MSIKESPAIPVYNYNECYICLPTNITTHVLPPATDGNPSMDYLSSAEIAYVNGISDCFRSGLVQFDDSNKEEIFNTIIKYAGWESILTNKEIENILLHPDVEGLQKIINVTNPSVFDRIRTIFVRIKENDENDISNRVIKIIETRYSEFRKGILKSNIKIKLKDTKEIKPVSPDEFYAVKEQNTILLKQIAEMQKKIEQIEKKSSIISDTESKQDVNDNKKTTRKTSTKVK